ncbi:MAG: hypothetical protein QW474_00180 [Candidatus Aenigmatarchaeota archaeon]
MIRRILLELDCNKGCIHCPFTEIITSVNSLNNFKDEIKNSEVNVVINKSNFRILTKIIKNLINFKASKIRILFPYLSEKELYTCDYVPISSFAPYVHKAIDNAIFLNKEIETFGIPHCFMVGYKRYMSENKRGNSMEIDLPCELIGNKERKSKFKQCNSCKYNSTCDGVWETYLEKFGSREFVPINENIFITDNERCMIAILLKENNISTKRILELKSSEEFRDICANCVGSDDVIVTGNNLIKKAIVEKELGNEGYRWRFVENYVEKLKERGVGGLLLW